MKLCDMDLNLFIVFDAISHLRETFQEPLFIRSGQGMVPTALAESIIEPVREALALLNSSPNNRYVFNPSQTEKRSTPIFLWLFSKDICLIVDRCF